MKKLKIFIRKSICVLLSTMLFAFCGRLIAPKTASAEETLIPIDIYLIGGQSNAVGYSPKGNLSESFKNIGYAGAVNRYLSDGSYRMNNTNDFSEFKWSVTSGLGHSSAHIGPEYGMAKTLNDAYAGNTKAFIFKSGAGGTTLRDYASGESGKYGNWYPRSCWANGYTPSLNPTRNPTGVQYQIFVENFKTVYNEFLANGYAPQIKGMAWMQGCSDLGFASEYESLLKTFITDIRTDLTSITDCDLSTMPFVIGKIATTFYTYNNPKVPEFNNVQQKVADSMVNVETIETSDLIIVNQDGTANGPDIYHFSTNDAVTLGCRFAEKLLKLNSMKKVYIQAENGQVSYAFDGNGLTLYFNPKDEYYLSGLTVDGIDIPLNSVIDNAYVVENVENDAISVNAIFSPSFDIYNITYVALKGKGAYASRPKTVKEGNFLTVAVDPFEKYVIDAVTFNGEPMEYIGDNKYQILPQSSGEVEVVFSEKQSPSSSASNEAESAESAENESSTASKGCSSAAGALGLINICAISLLLLRKRKE